MQPGGRFPDVEFPVGGVNVPVPEVEGTLPVAKEITGSLYSIRPRPATNSTMLMMRSFFMTVSEK